MNQEWIVYNLFISSPTFFQEIVNSLKLFAEKLIESGDLADFYYNRYYIPPKVPAHIRFGFYKLRDEKLMKEKIEELKRQGKIIKVEPTKPDLMDVDGVIMDKIKLTASKITQLITKDFEHITKQQAAYLIHLAMNPLFGYVDEREIYLHCLTSVEKAIREHYL